MKYTNRLLVLLSIAAMISCAHRGGEAMAGLAEDQVSAEFDKVPRRILDDKADTLLVFADAYPVGVGVYEDDIVIHTVMSEYQIAIYDGETLQQKWATGRSGQGPEDVLNPNFFASLCSSDTLLQMIDVSDNSHIYINVDRRQLTKQRLPEYIGFSSDINMLKGFTVAAKNIGDCMFYIYDDSQMHLTSVPFEISVDDNFREKIGGRLGYYLSCHTYANREHDRIIVPHYFFDEYSIYDFSGKLLKKMSLSQDRFDEVSATSDLLDSNNPYMGYVSGAVTADACYLLRAKFPNQKDDAESQLLVKTDWDGVPLKIFKPQQAITGKFCIADGNLYAITKSTGEEEIYYLMRYRID